MNLCKHCKTEIDKGAKVCPNCRKKQNGLPIWAIVLIVIFVIIVIAVVANPGNSNDNNGTKIESKKQVEIIDFSQMTFNDIDNWCKTNKIECYEKKEYSDTVKKDTFVSQSIKSGNKTSEGSKINIVYSLGKKPSAEFQNALKKAESYSKTMNMSKKGVYDQLVSQYGEGFSQEAAQWAIDNIVADWNANALAKAKSYRDNLSMSKNKIYDQLTSNYGEKFTSSEAQYAIDHLDD